MSRRRIRLKRALQLFSKLPSNGFPANIFRIRQIRAEVERFVARTLSLLSLSSRSDERAGSKAERDGTRGKNLRHARVMSLGTFSLFFFSLNARLTFRESARRHVAASHGGRSNYSAAITAAWMIMRGGVPPRAPIQAAVPRCSNQPTAMNLDIWHHL